MSTTTFETEFLEAASSYADSNSLAKSVPPGEILFREGDTSDEMYVIRKGCVAVLIDSAKVATIRTPGTIIGEMSMLLGQARTATLRAEEPTEVLVFTADQFLAMLKDSPVVGIALSKILASRILADAKRLQQETGKLQSTIDDHEKFMKSSATLVNTLSKSVDTKEVEAIDALLYAHPVARLGIPIGEIDAKRLPTYFKKLIEENKD